MSNSIADPLFFHEFEKNRLGYEPKDLNGQPFLKTNLDPFKIYLTQFSTLKDSQTHLLLDLPLSAWTHYPKYLIENYPFDKPELHQALQQLFDYLTWLKINKLPELEESNLLHALKYGQKEIERGLTLKRLLLEYLACHSSPPLNDFDRESVELQLSWLQFQEQLEQTEKFIGSYEVVTKNSENQKVFFNAVEGSKKVALTLPETLFQLIQKGDRFQFNFEETQTGRQRFKTIDYTFPYLKLDL